MRRRNVIQAGTFALLLGMIAGGCADSEDPAVCEHTNAADECVDPIDPCVDDPSADECVDPIDPCDEDPDGEDCVDPVDPCDEDPDGEDCVDPVDPCDEDPDGEDCVDPVDPCDEDPDGEGCPEPCEPGDITCCEDADDDGVCDDDEADLCFGDDSTGDEDGDGFCADVDCDDDDALVYPGAPEICGYPVANDCDGVNTRDGRAAVRSADGDWTDVTDIFAPGDVQVWSPTAEFDTLYLCGDDHEGRVVSNHSLTIVGQRSGGLAALSAGGVDLPVFDLSGAGSAVPIAASVSNVALQHDGTQAGLSGHGISCNTASLSLMNVAVEDSSALSGGGLFGSACTLTFGEEVRFSGNSASSTGGAILLASASSVMMRAGILTIEDSTTGSSVSAAVQLTASSFAIDGPGQPVTFFTGNRNGAGEVSDLFVGPQGSATFFRATFEDQGASCDDDNVQTIAPGAWCYQGTYAAMSCNDTTCSPAP